MRKGEVNRYLQPWGEGFARQPEVEPCEIVNVQLFLT